MYIKPWQHHLTSIHFITQNIYIAQKLSLTISQAHAHEHKLGDPLAPKASLCSSFYYSNNLRDADRDINWTIYII